MTTDHVALAIINGTTPQQEAGTAPKTAAAKKRVFENVKSLNERRVDKVALATKMAPKTVGEFKVVGVKATKDSKTSTRVYLKLAGKDGKEPVAAIQFSKDVEKALYKELEKIEADNKFASGSPAVAYRIPAEYYTRKRPSAKKDAAKADAKPVAAAKPAAKGGKAPKASKAAKVTAPAAPAVDVSKLANHPSIAKVTSF